MEVIYLKQIQIQVTNKIATLVNPYDYLLTYNSEYQIHFTFDAEWNTAEHFTKTARFWYSGQFIDIIFDGDIVTVPILAEAKKCLIGVYSGNLRTTSPCMVPVQCTILDYGGKQIDPPESVYDQILEKLNERQIKGYYSAILKLAPYFYDIWYDSIDYDYAKKYFKSTEAEAILGSCTSVRKGSLFGRNYDWLYDKTAEFRVHVPKIGNRYSSIGICGGLTALTDELVLSGSSDYAYRLLPFYMLDGINENGVVASMNVVPLDKGENTSLPLIEQREEICATMLVRYIVDNFVSAKEAVEYIRDYVSVYFSQKLHYMGYEIHYLVADSEHTYLLEFIENAAVITDMTDGANTRLAGHPYMTNFYLSDVIPNTDGSVYTPANQTGGSPIITNHITANGSGLERYNLIANRYDSIETRQDMRDLMDDLMYTRAYPTSPNPADPAWYTEFVGINGLTCASNPDEYAPIVAIAGQYYTDRVRGDNKTWQTVHSSVYDLSDLTMYVIPQESGNEYTAVLEVPATKTSDLINDGEDGVHPFASKQYVDDITSSKQDELIQGDASVGQLVVIKEVDESGKPIEWEAKDLSVCTDYEIIEMIAERGIISPVAEDGDVLTDESENIIYVEE